MHLAYSLHECLGLLRREQTEAGKDRSRGTSKGKNAVIRVRDERGLKLDGKQVGINGQYTLANWMSGMRERKVKDNAGFQLEHPNRADINPGSRAGGGAGWEDTAGAGFRRH